MSSLRARPPRSFPDVLPWHIAVVAAVTLLSVGVAAWLGTREPRGHRATAVVQLDVPEAPAAGRVDPVLSELVVLTSRTVIGDAIQREGLRLVSGAGGESVGESREEAIDYVLERLEATPEPSQARIRVAFTSPDSSVAPRTVNAIVQAYREVSAEAAREQSQRRLEFLASELRAVDSLLPIAEAQRANVLEREAANATREDELAGLVAMEASLVRMLAMPDPEAFVDSGALMSLPAMAGQPAARTLYARFQAYRSERESVVAARSPQHPDVQRLNTLLAATRRELLDAARVRAESLQRQILAIQEEVATANSSVPRYAVVAGEPILPASVEALEERAADLAEQYDAARAAAESLKGPVASVQPATGTVPVRRVPWAQMALGLVTGLLVGSAAVVGWERARAGREVETAAPEVVAEAPESAGTELPESAEPELPLAATAPLVAPVPNLAVIP